jgi:polysaccharide export outer membrane protein
MFVARFRLAFFGLTLLTLALGQGMAQEDYVLGVGDKLRIEVIGEPSLTTEGDISPRGTITFWVLGDIPAANKTLEAFKDELTSILAEKYLQKPVVKVEVKEYHSKEVVIQGAVARPGNYYLRTNWTSILKLISEAGGASQDIGTRAYIIRSYLVPGQQPKFEESQLKEQANRVEVDLKKLLVEGDVSEDKPVYGGDFVFIASTESEALQKNFVWVEGAVKNPGKINYQEGLTAFAASIQAGGFTEFASPNRATIHRLMPDGKTVTIKVKLLNIRKGKIPDVPLQPGDRMTIPESIF